MNSAHDSSRDGFGAALHDLAPATLDFGQGSAGIAANRRRARPGIRNLPGPVDHDVPVLCVHGMNGAVRAVLAGYTCHATIEKGHPGAIASFIQGCGAHANPLPRRTVELAHAYGKVLAAAMDEVLKTTMKPVDGPLRAAAAIVDVPFRQPPTRAEIVQKYLWPARQFDTVENHGAYDALLRSPHMPQRFERVLDALARDGKLPDHHPYPVAVWQFGRSLKLMALGGEVAGYSNDVFGYTPSARVLSEGDYEATNSGYVSPFSPAIEELIVNKVLS